MSYFVSLAGVYVCVCAVRWGWTHLCGVVHLPGGSLTVWGLYRPMTVGDIALSVNPAICIICVYVCV
jgi:hypothetical protein